MCSIEYIKMIVIPFKSIYVLIDDTNVGLGFGQDVVTRWLSGKVVLCVEGGVVSNGRRMSVWMCVGGGWLGVFSHVKYCRWSVVSVGCYCLCPGIV